jgi:hypothetical protein
MPIFKNLLPSFVEPLGRKENVSLFLPEKISRGIKDWVQTCIIEGNEKGVEKK